MVFTGDDDPDSNLGSASHIYARSANAFVSVHEMPKADLRTAVSSVSSCPGVVSARRYFTILQSANMLHEADAPRSLLPVKLKAS